jgi:putative hydrolase of the HAD superfamily
VDATAALHIGDDPTNDVVAARTVGLRTAWVNRAGRDYPEDLPRADVEVRDLSELAAWLDR